MHSCTNAKVKLKCNLRP